MIEIVVTCDKCGELATFVPRLKHGPVFTDAYNFHFTDRTVIDCVRDLKEWRELSFAGRTMMLCPDCRVEFDAVTKPAEDAERHAQKALLDAKTAFFGGAGGNEWDV